MIRDNNALDFKVARSPLCLELRRLCFFPSCFPFKRLMRAQLASAQTRGWLSQWYYGWGTFTSAINTAIEEHS